MSFYIHGCSVFPICKMAMQLLTFFTVSKCLCSVLTQHMFLSGFGHTVLIKSSRSCHWGASSRTHAVQAGREVGAESSPDLLCAVLTLYVGAMFQFLPYQTHPVGVVNCYHSPSQLFRIFFLVLTWPENISFWKLHLGLFARTFQHTICFPALWLQSSFFVPLKHELSPRCKKWEQQATSPHGLSQRNGSPV